MVVGNEPELTLHIEYDYSKRFTEPLRQRESFLGACRPNIRLPSVGKPGFRFEIRILDFAIEREIRFRILPSRNPSSGWISI